jgi:hypothetical protein
MIDLYSSGLDPKTYEKERRAAEANGFEVIFANPHLLLLDLDTEEDFARFVKVYKRAKTLFGLENLQWWPSKSGPPHRHVSITIAFALSVEERIALQAALGSDPLREILNLKRLRVGVEEPSRLFCPKGTKPIKELP